MSGIIALFSGQGAQYPGMGKDLYDMLPEVRDIYTLAGDILGFDVAKISFEADGETLARTIHSQPAIFTLSVAAFTAAGSVMPAPAAVAGHSLGEFAALCCAGAFSPEDGFRIIKARAAAMEEASGADAGAMYAIIGSDEKTVAAVCEETPGFVEPVNFNLPNQTVISGEATAATAAADNLAQRGARTVRLGVSSAFHTKMMAGAAARFSAEIADISFSQPKTAFYSNLTGDKLDITDYPAYFARHMVSPVRFVDQVSAMARDGLDTVVEFGPGKTGSGLVKKNNRAFTVFNVEDGAGFEKLRERFGS